MRKFEKVSFDEWKKACAKCFPGMQEGLVAEAYENIQIPVRSTSRSAGYDFRSPIAFDMDKGVTDFMLPLGIKCYMNDGEFLMIAPRSSLGFRYGFRLLNTLGVVDADFADNPDNEGHIMAKFTVDSPLRINAGDKILQGIITGFLTVDNEKKVTTKRKGGFGSTGKK